jgi:RimJ/RimL family protein N-acetyltransferase
MVIETKRLLIRPTNMSDLDAIYEMLSDPVTMKYFVEGTYSKSKVKEIINRNMKETHHFTVLLKSSNRVVGKISYNPWFAPRTMEIGWIFFQTATNKGYCTEAAKSILKYAFEVKKIHRLVATCDPRNIASVRVCEKLKMKKEGFFKECIYVSKDEWWDEYFYSLLEKDYYNELSDSQEE